jgi:PAS domain S-box-containing protein
MDTRPLIRPLDFALALAVNPRDVHEWSKVLLARASFDGRLELLTVAWSRALGYGRQELQGKTLSQLMWSNKAAAADAVAAILEEHTMEPVDVTVRCRDGAAKHLRLHRRHDVLAQKMFITAEERTGRRSRDRFDEWRSAVCPLPHVSPGYVR